MELKSGDNKLNFAYELFKGMELDNLGYIYRGYFTQNITDNILSLAETNLAKVGESAKIKKRVYSIMVECLQNITRHQNERSNKPEKSGIFAIQKKEKQYFITTGNIIEKSEIEALQSQLDIINSLEGDELKKYYKKMLVEGEFSEKGGAGLGLIDVARKSGNKLSYDFKEVNEKQSYFYLHTQILSIEDDETEHINNNVEYSLNNIKELHNILNNENILLIFNGIFNQDNLINLLSIIEGQMTGPDRLKKKVFNIMIEMLQNIVKHADYETDIIEQNKVIFFINEKDNNYLLNTGNYIRNEKIENLKQKIEYVNSMNQEELNVFYNKTLLNLTIDSKKEAGLGIIDLRLKSETKLHYHFRKLSDKFSFFTFQIEV